ncbi:hypothetical protein D3C85_533750 [compost metagenome]
MYRLSRGGYMVIDFLRCEKNLDMKKRLIFYVSHNFSSGLRSSPVEMDALVLFSAALRQTHKDMIMFVFLTLFAPAIDWRPGYARRLSP